MFEKENAKILPLCRPHPLAPGPTPWPPPHTRKPAPPPGPLPKRARAFREGEGGHVTFYTYDTTNVA